MIELERPPAEAARLRVYIGAAPGVGKTYRMLEQAHQLKKQGVDVVIGLVEPHGRAETAALIGDLEIIPQKEILYRSVTLREMDLDAIDAEIALNLKLCGRVAARRAEEVGQHPFGPGLGTIDSHDAEVLRTDLLDSGME